METPKHSLKYFDLEGDQYENIDELVGFAKEFFVKKTVYKIMIKETQEVIYESWIDIKNLSEDAIQKLKSFLESKSEPFTVQSYAFSGAGESDKQEGFLINNSKGQVELHFENESVVLGSTVELLQKNKLASLEIRVD